MIILYSVVLLLLGSVKFIVQHRATALGRRYSTLVRAVQALVQTTTQKPGNANKADPCQLARQQYDLGLLVKQRDRLEARHFAWQRWAERLGGWVSGIRARKGRLVPYALGVLDVCAVLALAEYFGYADFAGARQAAETLTALVAWK